MGSKWETLPIRVEKGSVERARLDLNIGSGEIDLHPGDDQLLDGSIQYDALSAKPDINVSNIGSHVTVTLHQSGSSGGNHGHNKLDLAISKGPLLDLVLHFGAGQAKLNLGELNLRSLDVNLGVGEVKLDLRGKPRRDYDVHVAGGVGHAKIYLPEDVGIRAEAHGALGNIKITGLTKQGDHYENSLYENSKVNVQLKVEGAIGEIEIIGDGDE